MVLSLFKKLEEVMGKLLYGKYNPTSTEKELLGSPFEVVKDLGHDWYEINVGGKIIHTNKRGVEMFNEAVKKECENYGKDISTGMA